MEFEDFNTYTLAVLSHLSEHDLKIVESALKVAKICGAIEALTEEVEANA